MSKQIAIAARPLPGMRMVVRTLPADAGVPWLDETVKQIGRWSPCPAGVPRLRREREYQCLRSLQGLRGRVRAGIPFGRAGKACRCCISGAPRLTWART